MVKYRPIDYAEINGHRVNGPLRGQKTDVYEGGVRVPLIARWPARTPAGATSDAMIVLTDLLATFADFFNTALPADAGEGNFSFPGALLDKPPRQVTRTTMVNDSYNGFSSIRRGDWKLILGQHGGGAGSETIANDPAKPAGQLFHLGRDSGEAANRYG